MIVRPGEDTAPLTVLIAAALILTLKPGVGLAQSDWPDPGSMGDPEESIQDSVLPFGLMSRGLTIPSTIKSRSREGVERSIIPVELRDLPKGAKIDMAELVVSVSTVYDTTISDSIEPLILVVLPASEPAASLQQRLAADSSAWSELADGCNADVLTAVSVNATTSNYEVMFDVTDHVRRWVAGDMPNYGLVIRMLSERRSEYQLIRDGRYDGGDARLSVWYSIPE